MTRVSVATSLVLLVSGVLAAARSLADPSQAPPADVAGEPHRRMEPFVGTFDTEFSYFPPGGPPVTAKGGTMTDSWTIDGRFLKQEFEGDFAGAPFRGVGFWGYSNRDRTFQGTWIDNQSTAIEYREGSFSADGKVYTSVYLRTDPATGGKSRHKDVVRLFDRDRHTWTSFVLADAGETRLMEAVYTLRKGAR